MASLLQIPPLPASWAPPSQRTATVSPPTSQRTLLPVGPAYLAHVQRKLHNLSFSEYDKRYSPSHIEAGPSEEDDLGVGDEKETDELLSLDPKEWKKQDQYAVLGLSHLRFTATAAQIKIAHRKKVLKHHPDKKASSPGHTANDDAFFKCIQKAHEVLTNPERRRQFDSVDPAFMREVDDVPEASDLKGKSPAHFFTLFGPVFERESRFSRVQPVPGLGTISDSKESVEGFYDFWYNFDSWRSFEWLDKEVNEGSDSRDDKRYTEKKNKSERARRKKEDTARLRGIVDLTLSLDPRIKRIKQEEKEAREAKKRAKATSTPTGGKGNGAAVVEVKETEEEKKRKEEEDKAAKAEAKKAKAAAANAAKKARRAQRAEGADV